jgi:hypothetical protein
LRRSRRRRRSRNLAAHFRPDLGGLRRLRRGYRLLTAALDFWLRGRGCRRREFSPALEARRRLRRPGLPLALHAGRERDWSLRGRRRVATLQRWWLRRGRRSLGRDSFIRFYGRRLRLRGDVVPLAPSVGPRLRSRPGRRNLLRGTGIGPGRDRLL